MTLWNVTELNGDRAGWPYHVICILMIKWSIINVFGLNFRNSLKRWCFIFLTKSVNIVNKYCFHWISLRTFWQPLVYFKIIWPSCSSFIDFNRHDKLLRFIVVEKHGNCEQGELIMSIWCHLLDLSIVILMTSCLLIVIC